MELVGVYHAQGTLIGELRYLVGKMVGTAHCALCDITHGTFRMKQEFADLCTGLPMPLRTVHLDEQGAELAAFTQGLTPCVVGRTAEGWQMLLDRESLESCSQDLEAFAERLRALGI